MIKAHSRLQMCFSWTVIRITRTIRQIVSDIVFETSKEQLSRELKHVAMKTGKMRAVIRETLEKQILSQKGEIRIKLKLDKNELSAKLPYIKYHWRTAPRTGAPFYKNPTTKGTEPIKPEKMLGSINKVVRAQVFKKLEAV